MSLSPPLARDNGSRDTIVEAPPKRPALPLTPRETEVLRLIALGHTSVEAAGLLGLSPRTIETHRARICRKLGVTTRAQLVAHALENGIVTVGRPQG